MTIETAFASSSGRSLTVRSSSRCSSEWDWADAGPAAAQAPETDRSFDVQLWQPALGPRPYFTIDGRQGPARTWSCRCGCRPATSATRSPWSTIQGTNRVESDVEVVRDQVTTELGLAMGLMDKFQVGVCAPVRASTRTATTSTPAACPPGRICRAPAWATSGSRASTEAASFGPSKEFTLAVVPGLTIPTGDDEKFHGRQDRHRPAEGASSRCSWSRCGRRPCWASCSATPRTNFAARSGSSCCTAWRWTTG